MTLDGPFRSANSLFFTDRDGFNRTTKGGGLYKIRGIGQRAREVIEKVQPFNTRNGGKESLTWLLHELSVIDKHRTIHLCRRKALGMEINVIRDIKLTGSADLFCVPIGNLDDRAILARWKPADGLDDEVYMKATIAFEIAFDDATIPAISGQPVTAICESLIGCVERVLALLEDAIS